MAVQRYLMFVSYIGKPFLGAQRQVKRTTSKMNDANTIQGRLEMGLKQLNMPNEPIVVMSSRTDSGVHALNSTCHVDIEMRNTFSYNPNTVTVCLNSYFSENELPIRVLKSYIVPNSFHCRHHAISRTYLYRILVGKTNLLPLSKHTIYVPIEELERSYFVWTNQFDLPLMEEATQLFKGYHDFRTFAGKYSAPQQKTTRKNIEYIKIITRDAQVYSNFSWPFFLDCNTEDYFGIDIYIKGQSFLYRQVRRTVAALVGVAQGKISLKDIKLMLEVPSRHSWCNQLQVAPAHGLYLCEVGYTKEDLDTFKST